MHPNENARCGAGVCVKGLQAELTLKNKQIDYVPISILAQENINGQRFSLSFLEELQNHYADPGSLYMAIKSIQVDRQSIEALATLRGLCRAVQKVLERGAT